MSIDPTKNKRRISSAALAIPMLAVSMLVIGAVTMPVAALTPNKAETIGAPVKQIPLVTSISTWQALDDRRLVVSLDTQQNYLVTLAKQCRALPSAQHLGISASGNAVYAGFDYITADGERCAIQTINRISHEEKGDLIRV